MNIRINGEISYAAGSHPKKNVCCPVTGIFKTRLGKLPSPFVLCTVKTVAAPKKQDIFSLSRCNVGERRKRGQWEREDGVVSNRSMFQAQENVQDGPFLYWKGNVASPVYLFPL